MPCRANPAFYRPDIPTHVVQRGHSREPVFFEDNDYYAYLGCLKESAERYVCAIHAYVLMTNHIHILATPKDIQGISKMMQYIGHKYVPYINDTYGTSGGILEGRYKASLVQDEEYLLICMRYIELNPVRVKMVNNPSQYRWSSYRTNGLGDESTLITPQPLYTAFDKTKAGRLAAYRALFKAHIDDDLKDIRAAWQMGTPLGSDLFKEKIERKLKMKVGQTRRGRPSMKDVQKGSDHLYAQ